MAFQRNRACSVTGAAPSVPYAAARVIVALDQEQNENRDSARDACLRCLHAAGLATYDAIWEGQDLGGPKGAATPTRPGSLVNSVSR
jgi:hypothetical protein